MICRSSVRFVLKQNFAPKELTPWSPSCGSTDGSDPGLSTKRTATDAFQVAAEARSYLGEKANLHDDGKRDQGRADLLLKQLRGPTG